MTLDDQTFFLINALNGPDEDEALRAIANGADVSVHYNRWYSFDRVAPDEKPNTYPIIIAAEQGMARAIREMIARGADVNVTNSEAYTALHKAAEEGHAEVVRILLEEGADTEAVNAKGETPLMAGIDHVEVVRALLEAGADLSPLSSDPAYVEYAPEDVQGLLREHGLEVPSNPLMTAIKAEDMDRVRELLAGGEVDVNAYSNGWTPLHEAAYLANQGLVALLLEHGADPNARTEDEGETPLHLVTRVFTSPSRGMPETVRLLLEAGADPSIPDNAGKTAVDVLKGSVERYRSEGYPRKDHLELFQRTLELFGEPGHMDDETSLGYDDLPGPPPGMDEATYALINAVVREDPEMVRRAVEAGADVNVMFDEYAAEDDPLGSPNATPLYVAASYGDWESVQILLEAGADPNLEPRDHTPLLVAASHDYDIVAMLLRHGARLTPLIQRPSLLLRLKDEEVLDLLVDHGLEEPRMHLNWAARLDDTTLAKRALREELQGIDEPFDGMAPLHVAAMGDEQAGEISLSVLKWLLRKGGNPNLRTEDGRTPLHLVFDRPYFKFNSKVVKAIEALLKAGADPTIKDARGRTPTDLLAKAIVRAREKGLSKRERNAAEKVRALFIEHGSDPGHVPEI